MGDAIDNSIRQHAIDNLVELKDTKKLKLIPETQYSTNSTQSRLAFFNSSPSYDSAAKAVLNQMIKIMPPALLSISETNRTAIDKILSTNTRQTVTIKSASVVVIKTLGTILNAFSYSRKMMEHGIHTGSGRPNTKQIDSKLDIEQR